MRTLAFSVVLMLAACGGSSQSARPLSPAEAVTVRVVNQIGELIVVEYTFARMTPAPLGTIARGGEAEFVFAWEPGPLEMLVDLPQGSLTSNRMSVRAGDRLVLLVDRNRAQLTRPDGTTD